MEQMTIFDNREENMPLASRLRPDGLEDNPGENYRKEDQISFCGIQRCD